METSVGLLTVHCSKNPGASLQAHALAKQIARLAGNVRIIDYCPEYFLDPVERKHRPLRECLKIFLIGSQLRKRHRLFQQFQADYLPEKTCRFDTPQQLRSGELSFSHYICGSDQIWNPDITGCDTAFFFDFVSDPKAKKCSYAASIGKDRLSDSDKRFLSRWLAYMDIISMREEVGVALLRENFDCDVQRHIDPTLLYPGEYWRTLSQKPSQSLPENYIFFYPIHTSPLSAQLIKGFKRGFNLPVVAVDGGVKKAAGVDHQVRAYGPCEFLWLIDHAQYVITNSFHGVVLSLLLGKRVVAYAHETRNSRLQDVLGLLGLRELQVDCIENAMKLDWHEIAKKQGRMEQILEAERARAIVYLRQVLK